MTNLILINEFQKITSCAPTLTDTEKKELILEYQKNNDTDIAQQLLETHYKLIIKTNTNSKKKFNKLKKQKLAKEVDNRSLLEREQPEFPVRRDYDQEVGRSDMNYTYPQFIE